MERCLQSVLIASVLVVAAATVAAGDARAPGEPVPVSWCPWWVPLCALT